MKEFQDRVDVYHRKGFYFEIKSETVYNYALLLVTLFIGLTMIRKVLKKEEEAGVAIERL